ncbi:GNAT family N-acetyltransferase [Undibacterium sp.]|jgi:ribosomal-protein-alanine N-acetyltransferase|uniref:GNAT family N-acetyltransferase n=1 Tax=Undibacterium sp. TaxID=1914977 RepID=UPI002C70CAE2|nr:GNAT family N-acetyltransferase [Undibacterium sp.]HTD06321.1 GNAT family N-acetyltransferase [Undibacterium sp.]
MKATIQTERLLLRAFTADDAEAYYPLCAIPEVIRYVGNKPMTSVEEVRAGLLEGPVNDYAKYGFGRFAVIWKETGQLIGFSGLKYMPPFAEVELGYRLLPEFWGQGLASEAGKASISFARESLNLTRLIAIVHPDNQGSANVVRKLGFAIDKQVRMDLIPGLDLNMFAREL